MGIDIADAASEQDLAIDQPEYFFVRGTDRLRQPLRDPYDVVTLPQIAQRELARDERMSENLAVAKQFAEYRVGRPQVFDPDRRIDQDHLGFGRRRGIGLRLGSLPPRRASRRAASRSTNALSASRTSADFSRMPV